LLYDALKCVLRGKMNCHQAAIRFKVPRSTIQRKLNLCREQHRLALELQLQHDLPSSSGELNDESLQEERCHMDTCPSDDATKNAYSARGRGQVEQSAVACELVPMSSSGNITQDKLRSSICINESVDVGSSSGAERFPTIESACRESLVIYKKTDGAEEIVLDQYTEDEIDFCGEEHVIGDETSLPSDDVSVTIDSGTVHVVEAAAASDALQNLHNGTVMFYADDTTTTIGQQHFVDTNSASCENDEYANMLDTIYANSMVYGGYVNVGDLDHLVAAPHEFAHHIQLRFVEEEGWFCLLASDTEEEELERAADRLSEAFRSVPSKSKLPKYLNTASSQHAYASQDYESVQQSSRSSVVLPGEFIVLRRHQPVVAILESTFTEMSQKP
uniref:HTH psq-type domain-containing protein n=1 Tax=Toxocara canis TaxID=6265 RepID=A0A183UTV1_TOXCA